MAAGMSLARDQLERFRSTLNTLIEERTDPELFAPEIYTDGELEPDHMTLDTARLLAGAGPWGQGFPEPVFSGDFRLVEQRIVGERHLKVLIQVPGMDQLVDGIAFNVDTDVWPSRGEWARLAYQLDVNRYKGRERLQFRVIYLESLGE